MSEYIVAKYGEKIKGARVLELGCGPALVAVICARLGASVVRIRTYLYFTKCTGKVVTTDYDEQVLELARKNIQQNNVEDVVRVEKLPWGEKCTEKFDFVFGSEVTYSDATWDALATTILSGSKNVCKVILSEGPRFLEVGFLLYIIGI